MCLLKAQFFQGRWMGAYQSLWGVVLHILKETLFLTSPLLVIEEFPNGTVPGTYLIEDVL